MSALWTGPELIAAVSGKVMGGKTDGTIPDISGVSIDSRSVKPGDLFIALKGPSFDGHDFVVQALQQGAAAALVATDIKDAAPIVRVADTQVALEDLGAASRARLEGASIAVTGSVGKTSTKEMLAACFGALGPTHASVGSFNNQWGVPLTLARMPRETRYGVFEIGMNHAGEIALLSPQAKPNIAIITTIEPAHMEFFASLEAIADAKAEIFLGQAPGAVAILNRDNGQFARLARAAEARDLAIIDFGTASGAKARLVSADAAGDGMAIAAEIDGKPIRYHLSLAGMHMAMNSVAALAAVAAAGGDVALAASALGDLASLAGRGKRSPIHVAGGQALLIDESYNASPAAMRAAIRVLGLTPVSGQGRRIAVLGDMRELGEQSPALHRQLAEPLIEAGIDLVFTVGPLMKGLAETLPTPKRGGHADTAAALLPDLAASLRAGDVVTVKGSLGTRMADIVKPLLAATSPVAKDGTC
jgi:UDP-N-acetylmuramoyl-tripeptide--D-alanyl-D-alanine ligase